MKKHWPLTLGAGISLLVLVFLFTGYFFAYQVGWFWRANPAAVYLWREWGIELQEGRVYIHFANVRSKGPQGSIPYAPAPGVYLHAEPKLTTQTASRSYIWEFRLVTLTGTSGQMTGSGSLLFMPAWLFMLPCAIFPVLWWRRRKREKLADRTGCCEVCGYDLRATPDRCPECGTVVGSATAVKRG